MKSVIVIYIIVVTCGLTHSYSAYGNAKRRSNVIAPMIPIYSQVSPQYYDSRAATNSYIQSQPQYLNVPYIQQQQQQQQRILDEYNSNNNYRSNPNYYYYPEEREQYQQPLYGIPTYHGDYNPKPYYFAQPSYMSQDDRLETANPLDYLHEEILQENERERNNAAFMQNLQLYNKQIDSLQGRQQQLQQIQDLYNLKSTNEFDDYDIEQPNDWYDQTSILVDPSSYDSYIPQQQQSQYQPQRSSDYDDEMVKELKNLKQNRNSKSIKQQIYNNRDWQQDMPSQDADEDVREPENYDDDEWITWGSQKRSIQPKKDFADGKQLPQQTTVGKQTKQQSKATSKATASVTTSKPSSSTTTTTTTESSKILGKLHKGGQKEVFLPRPAAPVRRPFSDSIMKSLGQGVENNDQAATPPIYKTIKQIIDMEQSLSHLSDNQLPTSKIRKRFVTNEEALAQQLNGLKRTSK